MKRRTIKIAIAGISALFIVAMASKPQHLAAVDAGKRQITASVQYAHIGAFPGSSLFYAEK